jgi:hypothetical protein
MRRKNAEIYFLTITCSAGNMFSQGMRLTLGFQNPVLHDIADRHNPDQLAVLDDGQVTDAAFGHRLHQMVDVVGPLAGDHGPDHDFGDRAFEGFGAALGDLIDHVPLGNDPVDTKPVGADDKRANTKFVQSRTDLRHRPVRARGFDGMTLVLQNASTFIGLPFS